VEWSGCIGVDGAERSGVDGVEWRRCNGVDGAEWSGVPYFSNTNKKRYSPIRMP